MCIILVFDFRVILMFIEKSSLDVERGTTRHDDGGFFYQKAFFFAVY